MSDLDLMDRFRDDMPPADPAAMARARARMFHTPAAARPRRRWAWGLVPAGALAAAVAVVGVLTVPHDGVTPTPATEGLGSPSAPENADAALVLRLAAAEARREPVLKARPDQFVYVKSRVAWAGLEVHGSDPDDVKYIPPKEHDRQVWLSVNGKRTGLLREEGQSPADSSGNLHGGKMGEVPLDGMPAAYRDDLPTDAKAMRKYLYPAVDNPKNLSVDDMAWTKVGDTLREQYLPPASVAALFDAAATIPGAKQVTQVDLAGRKGIAVSRIEHGNRSDLIFDKSTYRYLGERSTAVSDRYKPKGDVSGAAQLEIAIVDKVGQLP